MYSRFRELKITSSTFEMYYNNGAERKLVIEDPPFSVRVNITKDMWFCKDDYMIIVSPKEIEILKGANVVENIFLYKETIYYINKDILKHGGFSLDYRKHLQEKYRRTIKIVLAPGESPKILEICEPQLKILENKVKLYSKGKHQPAILIISKLQDFLKYVVIVDGFQKESGTIKLPNEVKL